MAWPWGQKDSQPKDKQPSEDDLRERITQLEAENLEMIKKLNRIERKVYRDLSKGNGQADEEVPQSGWTLPMPPLGR